MRNELGEKLGCERNNYGCREIDKRVIIAPIAEMEEIESRVHKLLKLEIKVLEMLSLEDKVINIKQSILAKAFRGDLGTNDPK